MKCKTCKFFDKELSKCHRNPPFRSGFPHTYDGEWCGEYVKKEKEVKSARKNKV